ncbi:MAG: SpoIIE family protein phosphatase [Phycisphaeraceae bacterium]
MPVASPGQAPGQAPAVAPAGSDPHRAARRPGSLIASPVKVILNPTDSIANNPPADDSQVAAAVPLRLSLTDFVNLDTLQEIQDSFTALTHFSTSILDADGNPVTRPTDAASLAKSDRVVDFLLAGDVPTDTAAGGYVAPIVVENQVLGSITVEASAAQPLPSRGNFEKLALALGVPKDRMAELIEAAIVDCGPSKSASLQFLYLLANSIARLCFQDFQLQRRLDELTALYKLSTVLAGHKNLQHVMDTAVQAAAEVMRCKAVSIRLLDDSGRSLMPKAIFGLSERYIRKGPIAPDKSDIFRKCLAGEVVVVEDVASDTRILYPQYAVEEGLVAMLATGMIYQGRPIGTIQLFTGEARRFSRFDVNLLRAISHLLAAAIQNARLDGMRREAERVQRQVRLAADVQKRMLPGHLPRMGAFDVAAKYVPSAELGGDFYDFIDLSDNVGLCIGDVVGKGVAASLLMASVRASLRAYAQDVYDIDEIVARVNIALSRDTLDNEFATLFYGVFDPQTKRLTYCNAGHEAPLLLRDGKFQLLETGGMIVGVDAEQRYEKGVLHLKRGDMLLIYTDGLCDALNFQQERFGRERIRQAMLAAREMTTAHDAMSHILWEMRRFAGLNDRTDDTTLVLVRVR